MKVLSLNCQRAYQPGLEKFLKGIISDGTYDVLLLQEVHGKVWDYLKSDSYQLVRAYNEEAGEESQLCIVYRNRYALRFQEFLSFSKMRNDPFRGFKHPSFGALIAEIEVDGTTYRYCSLHLHSGVDQQARKRELVRLKDELRKDKEALTILSGDFNAGYPGEPGRLARILAPEFIWASCDIGPTLDSRYSENVPHLPNRIAAFLGLFNIRIPLRTDHFFVSPKIAASREINCRVLPDRVSDHAPIELTM